jgi:hypothetical protein
MYVGCKRYIAKHKTSLALFPSSCLRIVHSVITNETLTTESWDSSICMKKWGQDNLTVVPSVEEKSMSNARNRFMVVHPLRLVHYINLS